MDEPVAGPRLFSAVRGLAPRRERVKVVLGGQGGDEIFGGYARYLLGYFEQAIKAAIDRKRAGIIVTLASIIPNLGLLSEYKPLMQQFLRDGLFDEIDARYFRLIDRAPELGRRHRLAEPRPGRADSRPSA